VEICFANPGTTEMALVTTLDSVGGIRAILGLCEEGHSLRLKQAMTAGHV
jgi:hypothetical protein